MIKNTIMNQDNHTYHQGNPILPLNDKKYEPYGACIYCGTTRNLEDEHIIPYGIGGTGILPLSSCRKCASITGRFEQQVLRGPMWAVRAHLSLKSRNPKNAPTTLPIEIMRNGKAVTENLPLNEHPILWQAPVFDAPGYLTGNKVKGISFHGDYMYYFGKPVDVVLSDLKADRMIVQG
jgi:hypothetical protein